MAILTIAICTYNRNELLATCLYSIYDQKVEDVEIIVVNNHPSAHQQAAVEALVKKFAGCQVYHQEKLGLSHARNLALTHCKTKYIAYLDDDARMNKDYLAIAIGLLQTGKYVCVGGHIRSWWYYGRPRWLNANWGNKPILGEALVELPDDVFLWGSNIILSCQALHEAGRFFTDRGMSGDKLGYGAENLVQQHLRRLGYVVHYTPSLVVDHVIVREKLYLKWHMKSIRQTYEDSRNIFTDQYTCSYRLKKYVRWPKVAAIALYRMMFEKEYYYQNAILDIWKGIH